MRLDPKYFNLFMLGLACIAAIAIFYSTISFQSGQLSSFKENIAQNDSLSTAYMRLISGADSVQLQDYSNRPIALQFWSSWSGKSLQMQFEMIDATGIDSLLIIAASVKDALNDARKHAGTIENNNVVFVDGTKLYNDLKAPGIPSYILFDKDGKAVNAKVGYIEGTIQDSLTYYLGDDR